MSGTNTARRRRRHALVWILSAILVAGLFVINFRLLDRLGIGMPVQVTLLLMVTAGLLGVQIFYWRSLDEVARAIDATSFYWAGLVTWTLLPITASLIVMLDPPMEILVEIGALGGAVAVVMVHALLYLVLWGWRWLRLR